MHTCVPDNGCGGGAAPETSTTLLRNMAEDPPHARWTEFARRYRPMMEAYMAARFPGVDADDAIQETLISLVKAMPRYRYSPDETGHFRNYLTGILRHKALQMIEESRKTAARGGLPCEAAAARDGDDDAERDLWRQSVMETALSQILSDDAIQERTKEAFRRTALDGEPPESVAASLGVTRNAVDQMKSRVMAKLKKLAGDLEAAALPEPRDGH